ncbi:aldehyde oxidoreductase molybdenum-binding subunit PaoC [Gemmatimonas groenlandica]|uniref:Xanthine dehydrogenase family protein molybdopterin-binding subunit n=1 Tax=Gemmatimonas groenlandica TaxID=2732249 RepID=A0A6M4IRY4_9BACT|nr:aldehyde oxidoreductase molybdenum-binding subunit PaoC [Gemmatimonas groenlandica]QJR36499.1 xanthine dehydrogenase family protein molybdopterin-binding subunit [Gemmatimonas groenlandica]
MKHDKPATTNPIDQLKVVGKATERIDGKLKTTGTAPYAYERHDAAPNAAYGVMVGASIAKGKISSIDAIAAKASPGVIAIVTALDAGPLGLAKRNTAKLLAGPDVQHYHQAVALVVAETFEQATAAAQLVRVQYLKALGSFDLAAAKATAIKPPPSNGAAPDTAVGNFAAAFAGAAVKLDATYTTPDHAHAMMEPHATIASWSGEKLTVWTSNQMVDWAVTDLAETLKIPKANVRVVSPYIGGGFGGKLFLRADALLAALGARAAGRAVKVTLPRPLMFNNTVHRPATIQRIRLGASRSGVISAIGHESWSGDLKGGGSDASVSQTRLLYSGAHRMTATRLAVLDLTESNAMRAPGEATGLMALEIAIDELAEKLKMDPIELRVRNDTQVDPEKPSRPFSQRSLIECLRTGAEQFGWSKRNAQPGSTRDGRWLVGMGVAAAIRGNPVMKSAARVRLDKAGVITVETDMTDIGTGSYTIIAQTAAETMGVSLDNVVVKLGDSTFPVSSGSGGQWGGNSSTSGVYAACMKLREAIVQKLGFGADAVFANGEVQSGTKRTSLASVAGDSGMVAEDFIEFGDLDKTYEQSTFGAHFVEVGVDAATGEIRVRRMLAVCSCGRILNPKTARSQVIGGMTMGVGAALMEEMVVDTRRGFFVNHDLAGYEVPVHADIPHQDVIFLQQTDPVSSPMKAKGVGELGICGVAAAVANAVYNATGVRVRDYPITLDKLLSGLPDNISAE